MTLFERSVTNKNTEPEKKHWTTTANLEKLVDFVFDEGHVMLHWQRGVDEQVDYVLNNCTEHFTTTALQPAYPVTHTTTTLRNFKAAYSCSS